MLRFHLILPAIHTAREWSNRRWREERGGAGTAGGDGKGTTVVVEVESSVARSLDQARGR
jgi:hypothetical protein